VGPRNRCLQSSESVLCSEIWGFRGDEDTSSSSGSWHRVMGQAAAVSISHWRWRQHGPLKRLYPTTTLHVVTTQKTTTWISIQAPLTSPRIWRQHGPPKRLYLPHHYTVSHNQEDFDLNLHHRWKPQISQKEDCYGMWPPSVVKHELDAMFVTFHCHS
jgi:hypothetical protein